MAIGLAIHIGLNEVDPEHYKDENGANWTGALQGSEFDAQDFYNLSQEQGFTSQLLTGQDATVENVRQSILQTTDTLMPEDILLVTYSGYGGQVPDRFNEDPSQGQSQTWCLYDRQFMLNELNALWTQFRAGVRILLLSDTCHNDTVARRPMFSTVNKPGGAAARLLPDSVQKSTYIHNQYLYDDLQKQFPPINENDVNASVIVISGCQDNQVSFDGSRNGLFTSALLRVWDNGNFRGSLIQFWRYIIDQMPMYQSPNLFRIGVPSQEFEQQLPFTFTSGEEEVQPVEVEEVIQREPPPLFKEEHPLFKDQASSTSAPEPEPEPEPEPTVKPAAPVIPAPVMHAEPAPVTIQEPPVQPREPAAAVRPPFAFNPREDIKVETPVTHGTAGPVIRATGESESFRLPDKTLQIKLDNEWVSYMSSGFNEMQAMFKNTLNAYMRSYHITLAIYIVVFAIAILFFVLSVIMGLTSNRIAAALAFGALSVATFLTFFMLHPIQAVEENLEFISLLGVAFNNYWARLMHLKNPDSLQADIKAAADDYNSALQHLFSKQHQSQVRSPLEALFHKPDFYSTESVPAKD
ncbi:MAG: caspase family protein [Anaerolineae bacterium]